MVADETLDDALIRLIRLLDEERQQRAKEHKALLDAQQRLEDERLIRLKERADSVAMIERQSQTFAGAMAAARAAQKDAEERVGSAESAMTDAGDRARNWKRYAFKVRALVPKNRSAKLPPLPPHI